MGQGYETNDPMVETVPAKVPAIHTIVSQPTSVQNLAPIVHTQAVTQASELPVQSSVVAVPALFNPSRRRG